MRIAFLIESLELAGAERVVLELAHAGLATNCRTHVITLRHSRAFPCERIGEVRAVSLFQAEEFHWPRSILAAVMRLRRTVQLLQPDVIAVHTPKAALIAALARLKIPALWVLHGHDVCWTGETGRHRFSRAAQRWARRRLRAQVAAVSDSLAERAVQGLGIAREKITVIPNGVDTERFGFHERTPADDIVVCVLGRLVPWKGPMRALEAFGLLRRDFPKARLWFVGDGSMKEELAAKVFARGWDDSVIFWGMLQQPEERLEEATVLWMPSKSEGLPVACAEAMASGLPVLGFDVPGVHDLLKGGCGVLIPPNDTKALAEETVLLIREGNRYKTIARAARNRVEREYSRDEMCSRHYELMRNLCGRQETPSGLAATDLESVHAGADRK